MTQLTAEQISVMEEKFRNNVLDDLRLYYDDAIRYYSDDNGELHRRRLIIGDTDFHIKETYYGFGLLSALLDDRRGWDMAISALGAGQDPGFGFLAYWYVCYYRQKGDQPKAWKFALIEAAKNDHLPSQFLLMKHDAKAANLLHRVFLFPKFALLTLKFFWLHFKNPSDRRLAMYGKNSTKSASTHA